MAVSFTKAKEVINNYGGTSIINKLPLGQKLILKAELCSQMGYETAYINKLCNAFELYSDIHGPVYRSASHETNLMLQKKVFDLMGAYERPKLLYSYFFKRGNYDRAYDVACIHKMQGERRESAVNLYGQLLKRTELNDADALEKREGLTQEETRKMRIEAYEHLLKIGEHWHAKLVSKSYPVYECDTPSALTASEKAAPALRAFHHLCENGDYLLAIYIAKENNLSVDLKGAEFKAYQNELSSGKFAVAATLAKNFGLANLEKEAALKAYGQLVQNHDFQAAAMIAKNHGLDEQLEFLKKTSSALGINLFPKGPGAEAIIWVRAYPSPLPEFNKSNTGQS
ncbi:hypothetical protein COU37_05830 [Candidatus Micrarchaeota archaeon CG10_big_fil_rev_8_21_14_0_10_45_29]|nr:MAG: hypothetical protein COU37_05830 [Candidatus Micrarchaeota archaeon CG10_big_fil_rev_8_21_14_0_10_45_29]